MISFPSQYDKKTFFPTGRVYSKKQTRHTFKYGLTKNLFILFKVFLNLFKHFHSCLPNICTFVRWKMKSRFQHVGLKQKSNVIIFRPCFLLLIMITEISFFCFLFCKNFNWFSLIKIISSLFSSLVYYFPLSMMLFGIFCLKVIFWCMFEWVASVMRPEGIVEDPLGLLLISPSAAISFINIYVMQYTTYFK